ncbi:MAG: DNA primase, partial [Proteobacteria bacterium]|nr:DNA primase [Pseudomonadota bacterium]
GKDFWGCCPFHNEKTPSFKVNEEMGRYYCFGCGEKGDIISFIMKTQNMQYPEAIRELAQMAGIKVPEFAPKTPEQAAREQSYIEIMDGAAKLYSEKLFTPAGAKALEYIRKRGFTDEVIKKYRLGYAPAGFSSIIGKFGNQKVKNLLATGLVRESTRGGDPYDFFRDRLMFPIFNANGQIIAFSGRSLDGSEPKYINTPETELFKKGRTIFGLNFARDSIHRANRSIIVEGQIDAIQMQTHGFGETVAPLGTALTADHLQILCKMNRNIVFCFDGDKAGQKAAARAVDLMMPLLRAESDVQFAFVTGGKDPDEILNSHPSWGGAARDVAGPGGGLSDHKNQSIPPAAQTSAGAPLQERGELAMKKIIDSAMPLVDFLWQLANNNFIISTPGGRARAEKFLQATIEKIADPTLKNEFRQEYDQRKFNEWHKWKRDAKRATRDAEPLPAVDSLSQKTLSEIAAAYPELIEKHSEFLVKIGADLSTPTNVGANNYRAPTKSQISVGGFLPLQPVDAEKFIVSLKLKHYLNMLQNEKKELTAKMLAAAESADAKLVAELRRLDSEIEKANEKMNLLAEI